MDNDERRKRIVQYVARNQGCKIQNIVDDLYGVIARPTIFNVLPQLTHFSCLHCVSVSLSQNGAGLGAMWGKEKAIEMLNDVGLQT